MGVDSGADLSDPVASLGFVDLLPVEHLVGEATDAFVSDLGRADGNLLRSRCIDARLGDDVTEFESKLLTWPV
jgi:hypothetical protein